MRVGGVQPFLYGNTGPQGTVAPPVPKSPPVRQQPQARSAQMSPNQVSFGGGEPQSGQAVEQQTSQRQGGVAAGSGAAGLSVSEISEQSLSLRSREDAHQLLNHLNQHLAALQETPPNPQQQCASCLIAGALMQGGPTALGELLKASVARPPSAEAKALYQQIQTHELLPSELQELHDQITQGIGAFVQEQNLTPQLLQSYLQAQGLSASFEDTHLGLLYTESLDAESFVLALDGQVFRSMPVAGEQIQSQRRR